MNHENHIIKAYQLGIEHGQRNYYDPPQWIMLRKGLFLAAYQNGYSVGHGARKMVAT